MIIVIKIIDIYLLYEGEGNMKIYFFNRIWLYKYVDF